MTTIAFSYCGHCHALEIQVLDFSLFVHGEKFLLYTQFFDDFGILIVRIFSFRFVNRLIDSLPLPSRSNIEARQAKAALTFFKFSVVKGTMEKQSTVQCG